MPEQPFRIDRDEASRYGNYVRMATFEPYTDSDQAVELAVFAWERATGPVMAPPYVCEHERIIRATLSRSDWDGSLLARVDLMTAQPPNLRWLRSDDDRGMWRDWPMQRDRYYEPGSDELARSPYLLTTASLRFTVPSGDLPYWPARYAGKTLPDALVIACRESVAVVVRELNRAVGPVLAAIEGA